MRSRPLIGIIAYGAGNVRSVSQALSDLGCAVVTSQHRADLEPCDKIIFPGVGEARNAMGHIARTGLKEWITSCQKPFLGICLGMQVLFDRSTERETLCLGIIPGVVDRLRAEKVPHMGWNEIHGMRLDPLFDGFQEHTRFYFAHSYAAPVVAETIATSTHGQSFSSAVRVGHRWGVQFHPEKSGREGLRLLQNFVERC